MLVAHSFKNGQEEEDDDREKEDDKQQKEYVKDKGRKDGKK